MKKVKQNIFPRMATFAKYSIKDLEKLSGIKAHTLRIWEKRFGILKPERTATNIRYYSNDNLRHILNVGVLNKSGIKISHIARMEEPEIAEKVNSINLVKTDDNDLIENLLLAMIDMNEAAFQKIFSAAILRLGFENTIQQVIFPFFKRIGIMWQTGAVNPAQEHFVSNIIKQKMYVAIDSAGIHERTDMPVALLFLPENELHELSLLFYNYALKSRGIKTVYLGQSVPNESLLRIFSIVNPDYLVTVATNEISIKEFGILIQTISNVISGKKMFISGIVAMHYEKKIPANIRIFKDLPQLLRLMNI